MDAEPAEPELIAPGDSGDERATFGPHHTVAQKFVMAVNVVVIIACLGVAVGLLYAKNELDNTQAVEHVEIVTTGALPATTLITSLRA